MIGKSIGNYRIVEKLNEGGMGAVYKAIDTTLDREVAIKVLKPEFARQTSIIERFRAEAIVLAKLNHPNIATLHSFFEREDELFMILEFVPGETLDKVLQRRGAISCAEAIPIFNELLDSIDHAHELGVIHRDIKPANIMLTEKGNLKVLDFGIARFQGRARITRVGNILGTLEYMSPEQAKGEETDVRSDVYSLGMTLYEILTGKMPFDTENDFELIQKQIKEMPIRPRVINPNISEAVEAAIIKACAKAPDERFQTAGEFRQALLDAQFEVSSEVGRATDSFSGQFAANSLQFGTSQTAVLESPFQGINVYSPETPTVEILREKRFYTSAEHSLNEDGSGGKIEIILNQLSAKADSKAVEASHLRPAILSILARKHYGAIVVGIFVLFILLASSFLFFKNEASQPQIGGVQNQLKPENRESVETVTEAKERKPDVAVTQVIPPLTVPSLPTTEPPRAETTALPQVTPRKTVKPRKTAAKKKAPSASEAEQLRQAEKLLTGN